MLKLLSACLLLCIGAAPVPLATAWPTERFVQWPTATSAGTLEASGLRAHVERRACGDGRAVSEGCYTGDHYLTLTVSEPGIASARIAGWAGSRWFIGVGRLSAGDPRPGLILVTDGGGSGGCVEITVAAPERANFRVYRLGTASSYGVCRVDPETLGWPRDHAGRGRAELLLADDRFDCAFSSCAATWTPPRVVALDGVHGLDVSPDSAFAPLFRADMQKARTACEHQAKEAEAVCAAYAADAARVGELREAWTVIDGQVRRGCRVRQSDPCPDIDRLAPGFPAALSAFLRKAGYVS